jgi:hypothetical protein
MLSRARKGFEFIRQFDGIVFFGGYFYPERQSDGLASVCRDRGATRA